ncbi:copper resistance protein C [Mycolicibacterium cyprinidarum]|uniref:Copper resistance protein C n=1 Tax=Mycolicibacterium cyprinidarum TaxID=2860311 RepID=A0ABQ4VBL2_9MYCO|nr:copper resistance protein C [Mycolicibacterium sp. NGTWSNA01]GJF13354.1 copper resistance protein C [Mycolicibacterium sp. NGTWS0302]GJF16370.1 copper resistance protein C [Mycolicibacterium sp. NGTWS1803]
MVQVIAIAALTVTLLAGALACAGGAWAHAARIASDPAENAVLTEAPSRVSATFNEPMQAQFAAMTVIGPDGDKWSDGEPDVDGAVISIGVRPGGPAGDYTVNYRATSADGHVVTGSWSYRLAVAATGSEAPPVSTVAPTTPAAPVAVTTGDEPPVWPFVVAASAIVAAGAIWAVRRRP